MTKTLIIGLSAVGIILGLILFAGSTTVKIEPHIEPAKGKQKIKMPAHDEIIEIERRNGRPPFRIHRKHPEKEIEIDSRGVQPLSIP